MPGHAASLDQSSKQPMEPDPLGRLQPCDCAGGMRLDVLGVEFEQARRVRVDRNECLDDVADDVDRFAVAEVAFPVA
jgi:hypothetical protein